MSTIKVDTIKTTSNVEVFTAKAWVNFNGTGTVAIRASGNVSSITDNSTGDYTVNFTTAMADVNYAVFINVDRGSAADIRHDSLGAVSTTSVRMTTRYATTLEDMDFCRVSIFR